MKERLVWTRRVEDLWRERSVVWLSGVRRVGKTCLCQQLAGGLYLNCDLPSVRRQLEDPELFLAQQQPGATMILDEVHRIDDPSLLLKIAADEHPQVRVLATGSSTLEATRKFSDTLTDRKRSLHLLPVLWRECLGDFGVTDLDRRLLHGGLPQQLLAAAPEAAFFEDWMDGFYARDIQELFGVRNRTGFLGLLRLICLRNGGMLDVSDLAKESALSRPTVMSNLDAMEIAHAIARIPPYHGGGHREIVRQPRIYAFDTGLVAHVRGWTGIRESDRGPLWENLVLDELRFSQPARAIHYWRDKSRREVDFVIERSPGAADAVEAKVSPDAFEPDGLLAFRELHPQGRNYLACPFVREGYAISKSGLEVQVCTPDRIP
jgi:predicted AAA+ superfamily ATPase